jgi:hypothetical protein
MTHGGVTWSLPPADLHARSLLTINLAPGTAVHRIHSRKYHPHFFGPARPATGAKWPDPQHRFDDPEGEYGVCYVGLTDNAAFVETVLRDQWLPHLSAADLEDVCLADGRAGRELRLAQFGGRGLRRLRTNAASVHAPYSITQAWSRALWSHPDKVDGIAYRSGWDDDLTCVVLFARAPGGLVIDPGPPIMDLPHRLGPILDWYEIAFGP